MTINRKLRELGYSNCSHTLRYFEYFKYSGINTQIIISFKNKGDLRGYIKYLKDIESQTDIKNIQMALNIMQDDIKEIKNG